MTTDPRYTQLNSSVFSTNEYTVQKESGVLALLLAEPSYFTYVSRATSKSDVTLTAWTRSTLPWSRECELSSSGMTREQAIQYYAEYF